MTQLDCFVKSGNQHTFREFGECCAILTIHRDAVEYRALEIEKKEKKREETHSLTSCTHILYRHLFSSSASSLSFHAPLCSLSSRHLGRSSGRNNNSGIECTRREGNGRKNRGKAGSRGGERRHRALHRRNQLSERRAWAVCGPRLLRRHKGREC